jgi:ATP-dependent Clp protease ATP-binding subunit ClpA
MNERDLFKNFTQRVLRVMEHAQEEAHRLQHDHVGTEHILLGLMYDEGSAQIFRKLNFDLEKLRVAMIELVGKGDHEGTEMLPLNEEAQLAVTLAAKLANPADAPRVEPQHLLLTLLRMPSCGAEKVLTFLNIPLPYLLRQATRYTFAVQTTGIIRPTSTAATTSSEQNTLSRYRFDKFTERARQVLSRAQEEAQRFQHNYIGTEHLLLGLIRVEDGVAARVLYGLGVELNKVRSAIEFIIGRGDRIVLGEIGLTPRAKKVIELAVDEARRLEHHYIGTEHILLGLVREGEGIAAGALRSLGVNLARVRQKTLEVLESASVHPSESTPRGPVNSELESYVFTIRARHVLAFAQHTARKLHHGYVGIEHLLLGLLHEERGMAARVLHELGFSLEQVRPVIEMVIGQGISTRTGELRLTPRSLLIIQQAQQEAQLLGQQEIDTGHLLLGLSIIGEGSASTLFDSLGMNLSIIQERTRQALQG